MSDKLNATFRIYSQILDPDRTEEAMAIVCEYLDEVLEELKVKGIIQDTSREFIWDTESRTSSAIRIEDPEDTLVITSETYGKIDKLVAETRIAARTPLLKVNPEIRGMYNGMEQLMALMDEREPNLMDRYGHIEKGGKKK